MDIILTNPEIDRIANRLAIKVGNVARIIYRKEVVRNYGRHIWDKASKELKVFKADYNSKTASSWFDREEFDQWVDINLLKR